MIDRVLTRFDFFSLSGYDRSMAKTRKKTTKAVTAKVKKISPRGLIFYFNIVLAVGIIGLTVYDYSVGNSFVDGRPGPRVLSAHATPTPTPTFVPKLP